MHLLSIYWSRKKMAALAVSQNFMSIFFFNVEQGILRNTECSSKACPKCYFLYHFVQVCFLFIILQSSWCKAFFFFFKTSYLQPMWCWVSMSVSQDHIANGIWQQGTIMKPTQREDNTLSLNGKISCTFLLSHHQNREEHEAMCFTRSKKYTKSYLLFWLSVSVSVTQCLGVWVCSATLFWIYNLCLFQPTNPHFDFASLGNMNRTYDSLFLHHFLFPLYGCFPFKMYTFINKSAVFVVYQLYVQWSPCL